MPEGQLVPGRLDERSRRLRRVFRKAVAFALAAAAGVLLSWVLVLWTGGGVVHAGGGIPDEKKPKPRSTSRRPRRAGPFSPFASPGAADPLALADAVKHLRAAELAPKGCVFFATIPDISRTKVRIEELAVTRILRGPGLSPRFASAIESMRKSARDSAKPGLLGFVQMLLAAEVDYGPARALFRKEVALIGLAGAGEGGVRLAALAAVGGSREVLDRALDSLMGEILTEYPQFTSSEKGYRATQIRSLGTRSFQVSFAYFENLFIVATGEDTITQLIKTYDGGRKKQLAGDKAFRQAEEKIGKGADVLYRVDLAGLVKILTARAGPAGEGLSYSAVPPRSGTLWGSVRLDGEGVRERVGFGGVPAKDASLVGALTGEDPLISPPKTIGYFPVDTVLYYVTTIDPSAKIARMRKDPRSAEWISALVGIVDEYLRADFRGMDLEKDVLPAFGGELALGVIMPPGKPPEILFAFEVKNEDLLKGRTAAAIESFMKANYGQAKSGRGGVKAALDASVVMKGFYRGHEIRYVEAPAKVKNPTLMQVLLPGLAYACLKEGEPFLVASSRRALEKAIRQQVHGRSVLTEKPDFARCVGGLRTKRTTLFYVDLKAALGSLAGDIPTAVGPAVRGPLAGSAGMGSIVSHVFGFAGVVDSMRSGVSMDFHGPLGPVTAIGLSSLGRLGEGGGPPPIEEDQEKLRAIGVALHLYATDFDRFPTMLSELYNEYLQEMSAFESPSGRHAVKTKDDIDTKSDYVYVSGRSPMDLSDLVVAYGRKHIFSGRGRNVLYLDGRVDYLGEAVFRDLTERQLGEEAGR